FIPGSETFAEDMELAAADWRQVEAAVGRARLNLPYGTGARQAMDIFYPSGKPEGLVFFIHGGYWRRFDRKAWSHLAAGATARGWAVAMPSYTLTPQVSISDITQEMVTALGIAADLVAGPIAVTGHSAGGHLAARLICDGVGVPDSVTERIRTCVPISGLFDLRPLIETDMNEDFGLDMAAAKAESPIFHRPLATPRTTVWVGAEERPVFLDQSRWLAKAWPDAALRIATGRHHFDVIDALSEPESPLMGDILGRV
ncbi:MAG: alpha/beta hydrolase, partial [Marinosulfonomonas sp.]|nr:alpha/beta hydrolase [Marinosulfonomonas sp.]